jgi:membrane-bound lytic murein transglycosylase D
MVRIKRSATPLVWGCSKKAKLEKNHVFGGLPAGVAPDLPIILNVPVQKYLHAFAQSKNFQTSLARSGRYLPMMRRIFAEHGLPQDLIYIALVESGFSPYARSPKEAVGIWQFIEGTARRYGLKVNGRVDERQNAKKSTRAAARYLQNLISTDMVLVPINRGVQCRGEAA